ncbi:MAG: TetR/AcrR family transcriptional regulator [Candidatus Dormibacteria bacterium]
MVTTPETLTKSARRRGPGDSGESSTRQRILHAAFAAFMERGYSSASTLEIATHAKVSKRELYALVGSKRDILVACIAERAVKMRWAPAALPAPRDRDSLARVLEAFGTRLLLEVSHPTVVATFRLAIAEAKRAPEVARALDAQGRQVNRAPLKEILDAARSAGLLRGDPTEMADRFIALLWGDLFIALLLRLAVRPSPAEFKRRAAGAALGLLRLYGP